MPSVPFTRDMVMDVTLCRETYQLLNTNIGKLTEELDSAHKELHSGMFSSWQGYSATEFISLYNEVHSGLKEKITLLDVLVKKFERNIRAWEDMAAFLVR